MSSGNDDIIRWLEAQFAKDKQEKRNIIAVLWGGAHLLFDKPSTAIKEIDTGRRPRKAAAALFWYCYRFSDQTCYPDMYLDEISKMLADKEEDLTENRFALWAVDILPELIAFRDTSEWIPKKRRSKDVSKYVQLMIDAARILMLLRKFVDNYGHIEYPATVRELVERAYEAVSNGVNEADIVSDSVQETANGDEVYGEEIISYSACVACGVISAAYAHMVNVLDEAYETSFHAYVDAFRYIRKADGILGTDILPTLFAERSLYLSESLSMFDKLVKRPEGVKDWGVVKTDLVDFDDILIDAGLEEEILPKSGIDIEAPADFYFPTQIEVVKGLAQQSKWRGGASDQSGPFTKDKPFTNVARLRKILARCTGYIWWADPHFGTRALEELAIIAKPSRVKEIKILSRTGIIQDMEKAKSDYKRFKEEMEGKGIRVEWRTTEGRISHDRFIIGANVVYNVPPVNTIFEGSYSEAIESDTRPPFERWWQSAIPIQ